MGIQNLNKYINLKEHYVFFENTNSIYSINWMQFIPSENFEPEPIKAAGH